MKKLIIAAAMLLPSLALAHPGHEHTSMAEGLWAGFTHPLLGLDHLLALLAVGIMGARVAGKKGFALAASFVVMMIVGFYAGHAGIHGVAAGTIETLITASIIAGGLFVLMGSLLKRHHIISGIGSIAMSGFAVFHGLAHGIEVPVGAAMNGFALGFVAACSLVIALSYFAAQKMGKKAASAQVSV